MSSFQKLNVIFSRGECFLERKLIYASILYDKFLYLHKQIDITLIDVVCLQHLC